MTTATFRYDRQIPEVLQALTAVHPAIDRHHVPRGLQHLLQLRASQLNGCRHCIELHTREALRDGEHKARLQALPRWREDQRFDPTERAALAWTEALTRLGADDAALPVLRDELLAHFDQAQAAALTAGVAMINLWNRLRIASH